MKYILSLLVIILCLSLTSCGESNNQDYKVKFELQNTTVSYIINAPKGFNKGETIIYNIYGTNRKVVIDSVIVNTKQ